MPVSFAPNSRTTPNQTGVILLVSSESQSPLVDRPTDPRVPLAVKPARPAWIWFLPGFGCGLPIFGIVAVAIGFILLGRADGLASQIGIPIARPTAVPTRLAVNVDRLAKLGVNGQRDNEGGTTFDLDNRGVAVRVGYTNVPGGTTWRVATLWERLDPSGPVAIQPPEYFVVTDVNQKTTWWYNLRRDAPLPPGNYQFTFAIAGQTDTLEPLGSIRFEIRGR